MANGARYNSYQYETSPRKIQPEYELPQEEIQKQKKHTSAKIKNKKKTKLKVRLRPKAKVVLYIALGFAVLFAISYQNSLITESFNEKEALKKDLATIEKENEQLKVNIENSLNLTNIEQLAKERLGMQKLDNSQKVYVNLDKKDYVQSATEEVIVEEEKTLWDRIIEILTQSIH